MLAANMHLLLRQVGVTGYALQMAAAQLGKVETLIGIGQYDSARMQLRQGAASTIRLDLKAYDRSRHTGPDEPQVGEALRGQYLMMALRF